MNIVVRPTKLNNAGNASNLHLFLHETGFLKSSFDKEAISQKKAGKNLKRKKGRVK